MPVDNLPLVICESDLECSLEITCGVATKHGIGMSRHVWHTIGFTSHIRMQSNVADAKARPKEQEIKEHPYSMFATVRHT